MVDFKRAFACEGVYGVPAALCAFSMIFFEQIANYMSREVAGRYTPRAGLVTIFPASDVILILFVALTLVVAVPAVLACH